MPAHAGPGGQGHRKDDSMILLTCATGLCLAALGTSQTQEPAKKRVHGPGLHHIAIKVADFDK